MRVTMNIGSPGLAMSTVSPSNLFFSSILLLLQFFQKSVQALKALFPEAAVALEPIHGVFQGCALEPPRPELRLAPARDEPGALEHPQVPRDRRLAQRKRLGQLGDAGLPLRQTSQNRAPRGVRQGGKGRIQGFALSHRITPLLYNALVMYRTKGRSSRGLALGEPRRRLLRCSSPAPPALETTACPPAG